MRYEPYLSEIFSCDQSLTMDRRPRRARRIQRHATGILSTAVVGSYSVLYPRSGAGIPTANTVNAPYELVLLLSHCRALQLCEIAWNKINGGEELGSPVGRSPE